MGGSWWLATLRTPTYGVTALLQGQPGPPGATAVTAALAVLTRTPEVRGRPGGAVDLHCAFAAPPGPFALEWRQQHRGAGRVLLAYESATARAPRATPGAELLLGPPGGDGEGATAVTLRLPRLEVAHEGTYFCSVFLPHGHAQQLLQLQVLEPPKVTLSPRPLVVAPGAATELRCHVAGFYPLDAAVTWWRRAAGSGTSAPVADTWSSGHRQGPDGTYSRSVGTVLPPARPQNHGDVYTCVVTHPALDAPLRATVQLQLAGSEGPSLEDALGLFLVAVALCGLVRCLSPARE
uniref:Ig-like domain-containing protein n=1 Tax=Anas zonorhyncha TaxID=75864 RepID=A0A8B9ZRQ3_9AVES